MKILREEKKREALKRIRELDDRFKLGAKLEKYFEQDKLYYSYGYSMDTIHYDESYAESVKAFEREYQFLVYHVVETETQFGRMLSFLYISDWKSNWQTERLMGKTIMSYTYIVEDGWEAGEFGYIELDSPLGYLMRIG